MKRARRLAKLALAVTVAIPPLVAVWLASSLVAYAGGPRGLVSIAGLLLFPVLPIAWEIGAVRRRRRAARAGSAPRVGLLWRLVARTWTLALVFIAFLVVIFPARSFRALAVRGDWMFDGDDGFVADGGRIALHGAARGLAGLYELARDDPYSQFHDKNPLPSLGAADRNYSPPGWPYARTLHPVVVAMTPADETSIASVGDAIRQRTRPGEDRVRALHDWVADRIAYDVPAYVARNIPAQDAETVFRRRTAVCAGYSLLLEALGKAAGEEIVYLHGDSKGLRGTELHAWNAARIDGRWALIDVTWDAGYATPQNTFAKHYDTAFLFPAPQFFVATHRPFRDDWQLLAPPIDQGTFLRAQRLSAALYRAKLVLKEPTQVQVDALGSVDVVLDNPDSHALTADVTDKTGKTEPCRALPSSRFTCPLASTGAYTVNVFVDGDWAAGFDVNSR